MFESQNSALSSIPKIEVWPNYYHLQFWLSVDPNQFIVNHGLYQMLFYSGLLFNQQLLVFSLALLDHAIACKFEILILDLTSDPLIPNLTL